MRTHTNHRPLGDDSATDFAIRQQTRANDELQFFDSATVKWEQTTRGVRAHVKRSPQNPSGGGLGFRGEYDPGGIYSLQQFVIISMGANAGTYIYVSGTDSTGSTGANPTTSPWLGGGQWVQLPGGNGSWL